MGVFDRFASGFDDARPLDRAPRIETPGRYLVRVIMHLVEPSKNPKTIARVNFKCIYELLESADPQRHPRGATRAWVQVIDGSDSIKQGYAFSDIKCHLAAVAGKSPDEITSSYIARLESHGRMLEGRKVVAEVLPPTPKGFFAIRWSRYEEGMHFEPVAPAREDAQPTPASTSSTGEGGLEEEVLW